MKKLDKTMPRMGVLVPVENINPRGRFASRKMFCVQLQAPKSGLDIPIYRRDGTVEIRRFKPNEEFYAMFLPHDLDRPVRRADDNPEDVAELGFVMDILG